MSDEQISDEEWIAEQDNFGDGDGLQWVVSLKDHHMLAVVYDPGENLNWAENPHNTPRAKAIAEAIASVPTLITALTQARAERDRYKTGLEDYGEHRSDCSTLTEMNPGLAPCDCGLRAALGVEEPR